jgi:hypothetical protein
MLDHSMILAQKTQARTFLPLADGSDSANGKLKMINLHKPNGNALKIGWHMTISIHLSH